MMMGTTTIRTIRTLTRVIQSVEPTSETTRGVGVGTSVAALAPPPLRGGWLMAALATASRRPIPMSATGRRVRMILFICLAGKYITR